MSRVASPACRKCNNNCNTRPCKLWRQTMLTLADLTICNYRSHPVNVLHLRPCATLGPKCPVITAIAGRLGDRDDLPIVLGGIEACDSAQPIASTKYLSESQFYVRHKRCHKRIE